MYSPKIREDLIPTIYQMAKIKKIKMTTLVNQILEKVLNGGGEFEKKEALLKQSESFEKGEER